MWYGLVRMTFWYGIVWILLVFLLGKLISNKSVVQAIGFCLLFLLFVPFMISLTFPAENQFISFRSPKAVLDYRYSDKFLYAVQGGNSCMLVSAPSISRNYIYNQNTIKKDYNRWCEAHVIQKTSNGRYKLPDRHFVEENPYEMDEDGEFSVYHAIGTNDYYLFGMTTLQEYEFELIYGYSDNIDELKNNLNRVKVTASGPKNSTFK